MVAEGIAHILLALISVVMIFLALWLWSRYRIDSFRDRLFILRDELFDAALRGEVSYSDRAYTMLRNRMNGMLRFAHHVQLSHVILLSVFSSRRLAETAEEIEQNWNEALSELPSPGSQHTLQDIQDKFNLTVGLHAITGSILLTILWVLVRQTTRARDGVYRVSRKKGPIVEAESRFIRDDRILSTS